jgi:hypothetical protein
MQDGGDASIFPACAAQLQQRAPRNTAVNPLIGMQYPLRFEAARGMAGNHPCDDSKLSRKCRPRRQPFGWKPQND